MKEDIKPPRWIRELLRKFAAEESLEEVEGDLLELYPHWVNKRGKSWSVLRYLFTVLSLLRPLRKKRKQLSNAATMVMIRSYFTMSWRTILKNRVSTLINLSGLTLGLTTSLLILLVVLTEFEFDKMHLKRESIFLMMRHEKTDDGISTGRNSPGPMADALRTSFPEVAHVARSSRFFERKLLVNEVKSTVSGAYVEPDIFRMMTYPPLLGDPVRALEKRMIVITESKAHELFGEVDVLGRMVVFDGYHALEIGAVVKDIPKTSTLKFEMAVPFAVMEKTSTWLNKWDDNRINTWVELARDADLAAFNDKVTRLVAEKTSETFVTQFAYPLADLHLYGGFRNGRPSGGNIEMVWVIIAFGVFMLLIACVNFTNMATAQSAFRSREIGVRKVMGASRRSIILQFLNESLVIIMLALFAATVLTALVIPSFNLLTHSSISFDLTSRGVVWVLSIVIALITALVAGAYPSFVVSRFSPALVLKGIVDRPKGLTLRRALVTFQFVISISVLIGTIVLYAQFDYLRKRPMGYSQENLVKIELDSLASARLDYLKHQVSQISGVKSSTAMNGSILYATGAVSGMQWTEKKPGQELSISVGEVNYDWTRTMGIEIVAGRDFSPQFKSDEGACLLNQSAVESMGLTNPVGSNVGGRVVIGVFKDYVYNNPAGSVAPMMISLKATNLSSMYLRIDNNNYWMATIAAIEKAAKHVSPDIEFNFHFTVDEYENRFEEMSNAGVMVSVFGGMTTFISCLGLFGLSGFIAERRGKEMSIRKVFGAGSARVLLALSSDILKPVIVAFIIVVPLSIWISGMLLEQVTYHVSLTWLMFAKAGASVVTIAFLVVLYHGWRVASEHPAVRLKSE